MRRIRMFVVGLAALFALSATSLVVASPALAKCNAECKQHKHEEKEKKREEKERKRRERAEKKKGALEAKLKHDEEELAKLQREEKEAEEKGETKVREEIARREAEIKAEKERLEKAQTELEQHEREAGPFWTKFGHCPVNFKNEDVTIEAGTAIPHAEVELNTEDVDACFWGHTNGSSEFKAGNVQVKLTNPLTLQGSLVGIEPEQESYFATAAPEDGTPELSPVAQTGPPLPDDVDAELLSPKEKALYNEVLEGGSLSTTVTIELATTHGYDVLSSVEHLLDEEGPTFVMPVKVKLGGELVGEHCYVGSDEHPIWVYLTTGQSGSLHGGFESLSTEKEGEILNVNGSKLVENAFASPGVEGCGGDASVDEAMDAALGLPAAEGNLTKINGTLSITGAETEREALERYHIPVT